MSSLGVGTYNSFTVIHYDPAIETTFIPCRPDYVGGYDNAYRSMRMYMPRTYSKLTTDYDQMLLSDADPLVFTTQWVGWMVDSVTNGGLGFLWLGSIEEAGYPGWTGSTLAEIAPVEQVVGKYTLWGMFRLRIKDKDEALMKALPWEESPILVNLDNQIRKEGSQLWATAKEASVEKPLMTYWKNGEGSVLSFASKFPKGVEVWHENWALFPQAMIYLVYRTADKALPADPYLFIRVTNSLIEFSATNSLLDSMIVWVEKFGGKTDKLRERRRSITDLGVTAEELCLEGDYGRAQDTLDEGKTKQNLLRNEAMEAKDEALFWIYVTEWCALLGTLMISSYALWSLMVKKRYYKEVETSYLKMEI